jgi:hypothetical protein
VHLRWVRADGSLVTVLDIGSGPALLFDHGLTGCWQNWPGTSPSSRAITASSRSMPCIYPLAERRASWRAPRPASSTSPELEA